jgi:hypothetical protein
VAPDFGPPVLAQCVERLRNQLSGDQPDDFYRGYAKAMVVVAEHLGEE